MEYIDKWFHFYETAVAFETHKNMGLINPDSVCFIKETAQLYTQNSFFGICKKRYDELEMMVLQHQECIKNILGIEGDSVGDGIINNIADLINFLDGFTDKDNLKEYIDAIKNAILNQVKEITDTLEERMTSLEQEVSASLTDMKNAISIMESTVEAHEARLNAHDSYLNTLNTNLKNHIADFKALKASFEAFKSYTDSKFVAIDSNIGVINEFISLIQDDIKDLQDSIQDVIDIKGTLEEALSNINLQLSYIQEDFAKTLQEINEFKTTIDNDLDRIYQMFGAPSGLATLDTDGKVPLEQLPEGITGGLKMEEHASLVNFPKEGENNVIYVALDTNLTYRWSGTRYTEISPSLALGTTSTTAFAGDKGTKVVADLDAHKSDFNNPHKVNKAQVGLDKVNNTSDLDKPISTVQQLALDTKVDKSTRVNGHSLEGDININAEDVGLGNVDNTSDLDKPISRETQDALDLKADKGYVDIELGKKAPINSPNFMGTPTTVKPSASDNSNRIPTTSWVNEAIANSGGLGGSAEIPQYIINHVADTTTNPHNVTASQVGAYTKDEVNNALDNKAPLVNGKIPVNNIPTDDIADAVADKVVEKSSETIINNVTEEVTNNVINNITTNPDNIDAIVEAIEFPVTSVNDMTGDVKITIDSIPDLRTELNNASSSGGVTSVNAKTGDVVIGIDDIEGLKDKLDSIPVTGGVDSVNGRTGNVTLSKSDVGLSNVDNTSDKLKPISDATQAALNNKSNINHTHTSKDITDLSTVIGDTVTTIVNNPAEGLGKELGDIKASLNNKADSNHNHDSVYSKLGHKHTASDITDFSTAVNNNVTNIINDSSKGLGKELDDIKKDLADKADTDDIPDISGLATKAELAGKANTAHTHVISDVTNLQNTLNNKVDKVTGSSLVPDTKVSGYDDHLTNKNNPHGVDKTDVGLANVTNDAQVKRSEMGVASGVATLDASGRVPSSQLPSYVDDVLDYTNKAAFPTTGETGKIYIDNATNKTYRWSGTSYVEISSSLALGTTSSTAYAGDKGALLEYRIDNISAEGNIVTWIANPEADSEEVAIRYSVRALDKESTKYSTIYIPAATNNEAGVMTAYYTQTLENVATAMKKVVVPNAYSTSTLNRLPYPYTHYHLALSKTETLLFNINNINLQYDGVEKHIVGQNVTGAPQQIILPNTGGFVCLTEPTLEVPASAYFEINILFVQDIAYIRATVN